ncbi:hypothetical protein I4U23_000611 [Adineta vaga]|nr:hypothetical protein I4U23_000611 [Adineta vaga]
MSNYEYSSYSSASTAGGAAGGFDVAKAIFNQADANHDGTIDRGEFQQWAGVASNAGGSVTGASQFDLNAAGASGNFESSAFESTGYASNGANAAFNGSASASSFEASGYANGATLDASATNGSNFQASSSTFEASTNGAGYDTTAVSQAANYTAETNAAWSKYGAEVRGAGLFVDANPQIIRRPASGGVQTYTQNIKVRFLQPPPIPPPGPLIIKEVRPPQPPPLPPLRIKQQAPPLPQPPPLILREKPPQPPASQGAQTVVRKLPALPVPPRSVIIERIPAAPPRPRDIIIERWIPYGASAKRKTIVQRAENAKDYPKPRNIIIQYEPVQVRVVRQFQRLGVTQENPQSYVERYGTQLLDAQTLVQQARAAGVVEDISPPGAAAGTGSRAASVTQETAFAATGSGSRSGSIAHESAFGATGVTNGLRSGSISHESNYGISGDVAGSDLTGVTGGDIGGATAQFSSSTYEGSQVGASGAYNGTGFESGLAEGSGANGAYATSGFESASYSGAGGVTGFDTGLTGAEGAFASSSYESSSFGSVGASGIPGFDVATATFNNADKNKDGGVDADEFKQFYQGGL